MTHLGRSPILDLGCGGRWNGDLQLPRNVRIRTKLGSGFRDLAEREARRVLADRAALWHERRLWRDGDAGTGSPQRGCKFQRALEPVVTVLGQRAGEHVLQCGEIRAGDFGQAVGRLRTEAADSPAPHQLVHQRRKAEDIGAPIPIAAGDPLRRAVRPAHGRDDAYLLECARDAEAGQPCIVGREQDIARVQRAVRDLRGRRDVERARQLRRHPQRAAGRRRSVFANGQVERVGGDVILGEKGGDAADAGGKGRHQGRVREPGGDQLLEFGDQLVRAFRREVEFEQLDGDEPLACRIVRAKHRSQGSCTNLMKNSKPSECVGRRSASSVSVQ